MMRRIRAPFAGWVMLLSMLAWGSAAQARHAPPHRTHHTAAKRTAHQQATKPAVSDTDSDASDDGDSASASAPLEIDGHITLTALESWTAPSNTRIEMAFSRPVTPVAPDSGRARELVLAFPGEPLPHADHVPDRLGIRDGVVDSVVVQSGPQGSRVRFTFRDSVRFRVFAAPREAGSEFRLLVDAIGPHAVAAEDKKLAGIAQAKKRDRLRIVAIDAGHGGDDTGAKGPRGVLEKRVTLAVAKALADDLNHMPGIRAVLTRDGDYFVPLRERYRKAERMNADLFISIHANSSRHRGSGSGSEVYFLSMRGASDQATQDMADVENAADLVGGVPSQSEDALVNILYDVKRSSALQQSQLLAETLLDHIGAGLRREERGVKQAGFAVLKSVEFPSVLVETAFINNPVEARMLASPEFQHQLGEQLAEGVRNYFQKAGVTLTGDASGSDGPDSGGGTTRQ